MKQYAKILIAVSVLISVFIRGELHGRAYPWLSALPAESSLVSSAIAPPPGFDRVDITDQSFAAWLRRLPLKDKGKPVRLFNGNLKSNQDAHFRVVDIDVGRYDLQQCADAVMRLRSEFLYSIRRFDDISFNFTSGDACRYDKWIAGFRPRVSGNNVEWQKSAAVDSSYSSFRKYLKTVFIYAGSYSLAKELIRVRDLDSIKIGDVFIQGGFPGHAVIVVDLAENHSTKEKAVLLAQSYMPAQDIHILINPRSQAVNPWYIIGKTDRLYTPEWIFDWTDLMHFAE